MADTRVSPWFGTTDGGKYASRHAKTLLKALRRGELRGFQSKANGTWRIHRDDLDAWLRGERPTGKRAA